MISHTEGPGLKILRKERWFGPGYCGICGQTDHKARYSPLIPMAVRWWDPDDGWKMGVLCKGCGEEASTRGPKDDDFASLMKKEKEQKEKIDITSDLCDLDGTYSECKED